MPAARGGVDDGLRADLGEELGVDGVDRVGGGLLDGHRRRRPRCRSCRRPTARRSTSTSMCAGAGYSLAEPDAVLERGGEHERLERRTGLPAGAAALGAAQQVELERVVVAPADVGPHRAVGVEGDERRLRIGGIGQHAGDRRLGRRAAGPGRASSRCAGPTRRWPARRRRRSPARARGRRSAARDRPRPPAPPVGRAERLRRRGGRLRLGDRRRSRPWRRARSGGGGSPRRGPRSGRPSPAIGSARRAARPGAAGGRRRGRRSTPGSRPRCRRCSARSTRCSRYSSRISSLSSDRSSFMASTPSRSLRTSVRSRFR